MIEWNKAPQDIIADILRAKKIIENDVGYKPLSPMEQERKRIMERLLEKIASGKMINKGRGNDAGE